MFNRMKRKKRKTEDANNVVSIQLNDDDIFEEGRSAQPLILSSGDRSNHLKLQKQRQHFNVLHICPN